MENVTIRFADGTELEAEQNGSCFIVDEEPAFPADLSTVTISGETDEVIENAEIVECASVDERYWFAIIAISAEEIAREKTDAQIMYTALMTDTLLEEE